MNHLATYKHTFASKVSAWCFAFVLVQQILVAIAIPVTSNLMDSIISGQLVLENMLLLICLIIVPYLPSAINNILAEQWYIDILDRFYSIASVQPQHDSLYTNDIFRISRDISSVLTDTFNVVLNVILSAVFISIFVEPLFSLVYVFSFLICLLILHFTKTSIKAAAHQNQSDRNRLVTFIDDWLSGKPYNAQLISDYRESNKSLAVKSVLYTNALNILCIAPILGATYYFISESQSPAHMAILAIMIPRQMQIVNYIHVSINNLYELVRIKHQFDHIINSTITNKSACNINKRLG